MNIQFSHIFDLLDAICDTDILTDREIDDLINANEKAEWDLRKIEIEFSGTCDGELFQVDYVDYTPLDEPFQRIGKIISSYYHLKMNCLLTLAKKMFDDYVSGDGQTKAAQEYQETLLCMANDREDV